MTAAEWNREMAAALRRAGLAPVFPGPGKVRSADASCCHVERLGRVVMFWNHQLPWRVGDGFHDFAATLPEAVTIWLAELKRRHSDAVAVALGVCPVD